MKLVVGLGNPGPGYADTRHNVGVRVIERLAARHAIALDALRFDSRFGCGRLRASADAGPPSARADAPEVALLAPQTFMNCSGAAVAAAVAALPLGDASEDLWVVFDDVDLRFGRLRLRRSGGAGGHRGLADVIDTLGHRDFPRLRVGVGRPPDGGDTADHVLEPFSDDERARLPGLLERAAQALERALRAGVTIAMNEFNRDPDAATPENG